MNIHGCFPSKYVQAADLAGQDVAVQMANVEIEDVADGEELPVLYFVGMSKGMVLNKTNATTIAALYGDETNDWLGRSVTLYPTETSFQKKMVPCIRVRSRAPAPAAAVAPPPPPPPPAATGGVKF